MVKKGALNEVRRSIITFRNTREEGKRLTEGANKMQPDVIDLMRAVDPKDNGIVVDEDDKNKGTAFVQQSRGSEVWDDEAILDWLRKPVVGRKALWNSCSSRVLDLQKWEAEVANGNIPKKIAKKFRTMTDPPKAYVRFGKRKDESL